MKNFKTYTAIAAGLMMMILILVPIGESRTLAGTDTLRLLATVAHNHARNASHEASLAAEKQRGLVKSLIGKAIGNKANDGDEDATKNTGRLTSRELAREKALLQQLEANSKRAAEVLESVRRLAAEVHRQPGNIDGLGHLIAVARLKASTASDGASNGAEDQRKLVKEQKLLRTAGGAEAGRLTAREVARETALLQQLEANARRAAEVLESVKRLATELDRQPRR